MPRKSPVPRIRIRWIKSERAWGYADHSKRTIYLDRRMDDRALLNTAGHEVAHVCFPFLDEAATVEFGNQLEDVLHRLGFRRTEDKD